MVCPDPLSTPFDPPLGMQITYLYHVYMEHFGQPMRFGTYCISVKSLINLFKLNGLPHPYQLDESISNLRAVG